ncbi:MAG: TIGR02270 family protein [Burkholderiales bacterium]|nr:TIGR02270 family protein [Burkholderiales bacterium]
MAATAPIVFGFAPAEISALRNPAVIAEHASEAAFLWGQRHRAVAAPHYRLAQLRRLDSRLLAHLAGLQLAGEAGWQAVLALLGDADAGAVFTAAFLAFGAQDADRMRHVLAVALAEPAFAAPFCDAMGWHEPGLVHSGLQRLLASPAGDHRRLGCAALTAQRAHDQRALARLVGDADASVRALALQAAGAMKLDALRPRLAAAFEDADPHCRFWAAWSLALMGDAAAARSAFEIGCFLPDVAAEAIQVAMRCAEPDWCRDTIRTLATNAATRRFAIQATGAFGDPATVPWLIEQCADPAQAPVAGEAVTAITGADLKRLDLDTEPPADAPERRPEDDDLPWPDAPRLQAWWAGPAGRLGAGQRHLGGEPVSAVAAWQLLREGPQRLRRAAALELGRLEARAVVFPVDARADWQAGRLAA